MQAIFDAQKEVGPNPNPNPNPNPIPKPKTGPSPNPNPNPNPNPDPDPDPDPDPNHNPNPYQVGGHLNGRKTGHETKRTSDNVTWRPGGLGLGGAALPDRMVARGPRVL